MVIVIRSDGEFDLKYRNKVYSGLTKLEFLEAVKSIGIPSREIKSIRDDANCHVFGDFNLYYLYSKNESDDFLRGIS